MMEAGYAYDRAWVTVADRRDVVVRVESCGDANSALATYLGNTKVSYATILKDI